MSSTLAKSCGSTFLGGEKKGLTEQELDLDQIPDEDEIDMLFSGQFKDD